MAGPETWQALQARLTAARVAIEAGDRERALEAVTAALDIDPNYLAAQALRERILAPSSPAGAELIGSRDSVAADLNLPSRIDPEERPQLSDVYAQFEQRAKHRRVDRQLDAARAAMSAGHFKEASTALDEVIELDPNLPELTALTAQYERLSQPTVTARRGPRFAAAMVFAITVLAATWLQESTSLISYPMIVWLSSPMIASSPIVEAPIPAVTPASAASVLGTTGEPEPATDVASGIEPSIVRAASVSSSAASPDDTIETPPHIQPAVVQAAVTPAMTAAAPAPLPSPRTAAVHESSEVAPIATPTLPPPANVTDDSFLVKQVLQRYRIAYEGLDARSAQAVWPAVNQAALARAFDGLASQTLVFDVCVVHLGGDTATATCQGSARYVTKIGNREPRVEPRVWTFALNKNGGDWKIDSARAER